MRIFFYFGAKFLEWPLAVSRELAVAHHDLAISGLVAGEREVFERVANAESPEVSPLHYLDNLEREWIANAYDAERLAYYESLLGSEALNRIIIADRQVGGGFVSGARLPGTRIQQLSARDQLQIPRRYLVGLLDYLFEALTTARPDVVFCYVVAGAPAMALAVVAQHLQVPFLCLAPARVGSRYIIDDTVGGLLGPTQRLFERSLRDETLVAEALPRARQFLDEFRSRPSAPEYTDYNRRKFGDQSLSSVVGAVARHTIGGVRDIMFNRGRELRRPSVWAKRTHRVSVKARAFRLMRGRTFAANHEIGIRPFAYYPLHVDPEASTMAAAPQFTDQLSVIEGLAKSLPISMDLVVKEHTPMLGRRPSGFYQRIREMPRVTLVSPFEDSFWLVRNAALTAVITGTAAWEAILLRRPALVFGSTFYLALGEGAICCPDLSRLPDKIQEALQAREVSDRRLILFLASIYMTSFDLPQEALWGDVSSQTVSRHPEVLNVLCERITEAVRENLGSPRLSVALGERSNEELLSR